MMKILRLVAIVLLFFLAFGALYGSWIMMSDPGGEKFQWSTQLLKGTPFSDFFIPGLLLFICNGVFPLVVIFLIILKIRNYAWFVIIQGFILTGWLTAEVIFNKDLFSPVWHYPFYTVGIILIVAGFMIKTLSRQN